MIDFDYDDRNFWALTQCLSAKERVSMMKSAMRASARDLKQRAEEKLLSRLTSVRNRTAMKKTIWTQVYTRTAGFRVSVAGNAHCYPSRMKNKDGGTRDLPLGRWFETGTQQRSTSRGLTRGTLPSIGFLGEASKEMESTISDRIEDHFFEQQMKFAKKYGCIPS